MRSEHNTLLISAVLAVSALGGRAEAQLWDPVAGKARPHMIVGFDTSVTMGITSDCTTCHRDNPGVQTRLDDAKIQIRDLLPRFDRYFYYGAFQYRGCGFAHVVGQPIRPDRTDPDASLQRVDDMIASVRNCGSSENSLPGGGANPPCLTPTNACAGDGLKLREIIQGGVPGLSIPQPSGTTTPVCVGGAAQGNTLTVEQLLFEQFGQMVWPRWNANVQPSDVRTQLCDPLQSGLASIRRSLELCYGNEADAAALWDLRNIESPSRCVPGQVANACTNGSALADTCVCDNTQPGCFTDPQNVSECGLPFEFRARQQVGVCTSYSPQSFGNFFRDDRDNITRGGCRENIALFFSDGYTGASVQMAAEASVARARYYESPERDANGQPRSNMFLFHVSESFTSAADAMADALGNPRYDATDGDLMVSSFAALTNRVYRGRYVGANVTGDRFGTRLVVHSFEVPAGTGDIGERYLGRPSRLAVYRVDPVSGEPEASPLYATDWRSRAGVGSRIICEASPSGQCALSARELRLFGGISGRMPFRNDVERIQDVGALPGERERRTWGYMLGGSSTQPVIVDHPRDPPSGPASAAYARFASSTRVVQRPRTLYVMSNSFLHGIHMGDRVQGPTEQMGALGPQLAFSYDDASNRDAGSELFRYFPRGWLAAASLDVDRADPEFNDVVVQPMITGQIQVADLLVERLDQPGNQDRKFATILAAAQGRTGGGIATLDITDPRAPRVLREWILPGRERASAEPTLVQWVPAANGVPQPAVITTSGIDVATRTLRVWNARSGVQITSVALPGSGSMATEPTCLDVTGRGSITHCYALSTAGNLFRIPVRADGAFGAPVSIEPAGVVDGRRVFMTRPVVFFDSEGAVNIAFGSGRSTDFTEGSDTGSNRFFKLVDRFNRSETGAVQATLTDVCGGGRQRTPGIIELGASRVVSPPVISKGVLAFTTYAPGASQCEAGGAAVWALDFARCTDMIDPTPGRAPQAHALATPGIPGSPVILRGAQRIVTQTSGAGNAAPAAEQVRTRGGDRTILRRLFWRPEIEAE